ncbi:MAG: nicotinamide mononucleotide transporter family protein, partial [Bacteroidota bacterium]
TTAIFFVGMWFMARKQIENWIYWIIGDFISIPLYHYKGLTLTSIQYMVFLGLAVAGFLSWRRTLNAKDDQPISIHEGA